MLKGYKVSYKIGTRLSQGLKHDQNAQTIDTMLMAKNKHAVIKAFMDLSDSKRLYNNTLYIYKGRDFYYCIYDLKIEQD